MTENETKWKLNGIMEMKCSKISICCLCFQNVLTSPTIELHLWEFACLWKRHHQTYLDFFEIPKWLCLKFLQIFYEKFRVLGYCVSVIVLYMECKLESKNGLAAYWKELTMLRIKTWLINMTNLILCHQLFFTVGLLVWKLL